MQPAMEKVKNIAKHFVITKEDIKQRLPITTWLPKYNLQKFQGDLIAGLTVGIMVVPQSLAFATFAGLPPHYGLYTAFAPGILYLFLGSAKDMNVGPTVISSLLTKRYNMSGSPLGASCLALFTGLILTLMGMFKLGFVVKFIPASVITGFVSAAAFTIAIGQLKGLFGHKNAPRTFYGRIYHFFTNLKNTNGWDAGIGLISLAFLLTLQFISKKKLTRPDDKAPRWKMIGFKVMKFICVAKSALICVIATIAAFGLYQSGHKGYTLPGELPAGMPEFSFPIRTVEDPKSNTTISTMEYVKDFGAGLIILPMILFIEDVSIAKALGRQNKYNVDASQELYAVGLGNLFGSLFGGYPVTGSFSRSAVNSMSGAATTFSGIITSGVVLLALAFLTPVFFYIPMAALAAMVMAAVINMIDFSAPKKIWKINKIDIIPYIISFLGTFYELEVGVLGGSAVSLLIMLFREVKPRQQVINTRGSAYGTVKVKGGIWYPGTESLVNTFQTMIKDNPSLKVIRLDLEKVYEFDYTVIYGLQTAATDLEINNVALKFVNVNEKRVRDVIINAGCGEMIEMDIEDVEAGKLELMMDTNMDEISIEDQEKMAIVH